MSWDSSGFYSSFSFSGFTAPGGAAQGWGRPPRHWSFSPPQLPTRPPPGRSLGHLGARGHKPHSNLMSIVAILPRTQMVGRGMEESIPHTSETGPTPRIPESPGGPWKLCKVQGSTRPGLAVPGPSPPPPSQGGKAKMGARCPTEGNGDTPSQGPEK